MSAWASPGWARFLAGAVAACLGSFVLGAFGVPLLVRLPFLFAACWASYHVVDLAWVGWHERARQRRLRE